MRSGARRRQGERMRAGGGDVGAVAAGLGAVVVVAFAASAIAAEFYILRLARYSPRGVTCRRSHAARLHPRFPPARGSARVFRVADDPANTDLRDALDAREILRRHAAVVEPALI